MASTNDNICLLPFLRSIDHSKSPDADEIASPNDSEAVRTSSRAVGYGSLSRWPSSNTCFMTSDDEGDSTLMLVSKTLRDVSERGNDRLEYSTEDEQLVIDEQPMDTEDSREGMLNWYDKDKSENVENGDKDSMACDKEGVNEHGNEGKHGNEDEHWDELGIENECGITIEDESKIQGKDGSRNWNEDADSITSHNTFASNHSNFCNDQMCNLSQSSGSDVSSLMVSFSRSCVTCTDDIACCTSCGTCINLREQEVFCHSRLAVIICKRCHDFVNLSDFDVDSEDGYELYCTLCGDGDEIILCSTCKRVVCQVCIMRISGQQYLQVLLNNKEDKAFQCYVCDTSDLALYIRHYEQYMERRKMQEAYSPVAGSTLCKVQGVDYLPKLTSTTSRERNRSPQSGTSGSHNERDKDRSPQYGASGPHSEKHKNRSSQYGTSDPHSDPLDCEVFFSDSTDQLLACREHETGSKKTAAGSKRRLKKHTPKTFAKPVPTTSPTSDNSSHNMHIVDKKPLPKPGSDQQLDDGFIDIFTCFEEPDLKNPDLKDLDLKNPDLKDLEDPDVRDLEDPTSDNTLLMEMSALVDKHKLARGLLNEKPVKSATAARQTKDKGKEDRECESKRVASASAPSITNSTAKDCAMKRSKLEQCKGGFKKFETKCEKKLMQREGKKLKVSKQRDEDVKITSVTQTTEGAESDEETMLRHVGATERSSCDHGRSSGDLSGDSQRSEYGGKKRVTRCLSSSSDDFEPPKKRVQQIKNDSIRPPSSSNTSTVKPVIINLISSDEEDEKTSVQFDKNKLHVKPSAKKPKDASSCKENGNPLGSHKHNELRQQRRKPRKQLKPQRQLHGTADSESDSDNNGVQVKHRSVPKPQFLRANWSINRTSYRSTNHPIN